MRRGILVAIVVVALGLALSGENERQPAVASNPGTVAAPLISCSDVNADSAVSGPDFFGVLSKFGTAYPGLDFSYLYDLAAPPDGTVAGPDFFAVLTDFGLTCPVIDRQVAQATLAGLALGPDVIDCNHAAILALGYELPTTIDAPGQGIHYFHYGYWDGAFDIEHPEGLVCDNMGGRLVAQLYYVEGDPGEGGVGWGPVVPPPADNTNIEVLLFTLLKCSM
jgi:hypothetical protein